jgi:hypothetical protein
LADRHVVADARLHRDLVDLAIRTFEHQDPLAADQRLGFDLDIVDLQTQPLAGLNVDQFGGVGRLGRREQDLIPPGLVDPPAQRRQGKPARVERRYRDARSGAGISHGVLASWCEPLVLASYSFRA